MPGTGVFVDKPIIGAVHGYVVGGAYCLIQFCDLAVADETADFFYPEAQIGFCGGLIASHAGRVPYKIAMEFMLTGKHFSAQRAYEVGMVNKVTPKGQAVEGAMEYARILADSAPLVMAALSRFTRETVLPRGPSELAGLARKELLKVSRSDDQKEGGRAFAEKRKPNFTGR
jgi:enoyl-CoA hydratase/carnithine racemase